VAMSHSGKARLTLRPGDPGTKRHVEQFGKQLVAVRYRYDEAKLRRYTTVEIIVDDRPWRPEQRFSDPDRLVGLRVGYAEEAMRLCVRAAGGAWDRATKLWWIPLHAVVQLGFEERIAAWPRPDP
jgi:hypothetical protein